MEMANPGFSGFNSLILASVISEKYGEKKSFKNRSKRGRFSGKWIKTPSGAPPPTLSSPSHWQPSTGGNQQLSGCVCCMLGWGSMTQISKQSFLWPGLRWPDSADSQGPVGQEFIVTQTTWHISNQTNVPTIQPYKLRNFINVWN